MKRILGLDLGTNSIGWALVQQDFEKKLGNIDGLGSRIIPMSQDVLGKFESGVSISQTAERTDYRGVRRLYQRDNLRRERLHRVLNILGFLPPHYAKNIDFEKHLGQFKKETKLNYRKLENGKHEFIFINSFNEMLEDFKTHQPELFYKKSNGEETKIPLDWTIYYLRKKALSQKISKEELAWLLLNFNQKRGYYQLRGEEIKGDDSSEIIQKKVCSVEKKEKDAKYDKYWYEVKLEDGLIYRAAFYSDISHWIGQVREFIKKKTVLKSGEEKIELSFLPSIDEIEKMDKKRKDKLFEKIRIKTQNEIKKSKKEVGEYIYETLLANPTQKIRGKLIKTIERKFYKKELQKILDKQIELQPELFTTENYQKCIEELYPRNEAHRNNIKDKDFEYLFLDDIIFYQRSLKSKKSTISGCQYESRTFFIENKETGKKEKKIQALKVIPKSHPLFIEFRMWQFLRNLKIYHKQDKKNVDITSICIQNNAEWCDLFDFLMEKKEVEQKHIIDYFVKQGRIEKTKKDEYRWNYQEDKKLPMNETKAQFISRFKKVEGFDLERLTVDFQIKLWHIIYSVKDKNEFIQALKTFANKNEIDVDSFVEKFKAFPPYKSEYGAYSQKAIKKLLPLMRVGRYWNENDISEEVKNRIEDIKVRLECINYDNEVFEKDEKNRLENIVDDACPKQLLKSFVSFKDKNHLEGLNTYQACYAVYERHSEVGEITQWKTSADIDRYLNHFKQHSLRNPIVEQVITETLRTVRDIWNYYGGKFGVKHHIYKDEKTGKNKKGYYKLFDEIHLELGRDMKNSAEKRKSLTNRNAENERTNLRIKELLKELKSAYTEVDIRPYSTSHQEILKIYEEGVSQNPKVKYDKVSEEDILKIRKNNSPKPKEIEKYKLWLEQGYISPYTGQTIPLSRLFSEAYQIEHIIPQSRYFDNSLSNKVICESAVNEQKDNKTAYEYLKENGGSVVELGNNKNVRLFDLKEYEAHCGKYFKKNRTKLNNLLSEDIPEGFIERQMNDSRYIAKVVKSLLSNIVREDGEKEATSKNLLPTPGGVTSRLKHNWGLNDKWNELIAPRFKRLNEMTNSNDYGYWDKEINAFRTQVPDELAKNFNKKRIDHRHHALDALVIACTTRDHTHYLHSLESEKENYSLKDKLLIKNENEHYTKNFQLPWLSFPVDAKNKLEKIIVSFKQNLRVINKTNNKTWQWVEQKDGKYKKELVKQTKGENWAIRKPLHKETVSGAANIKRIKKGLSSLDSFLSTPDLIVNKEIKKKVKSLNTLFDRDLKQIKKHLKTNPIKIDGKKVDKIQVYEWTKGATATRTALTDKFTRKQLEAVTDSGIQNILENHIKNYIDEKGKECFDLAFSPEGVEALNKNIQQLNNGKKHQPIYKVRLYEVGSKFAVSENKESPKATKYVEAAKGTNLFFAIYENKKGERNYASIPLNIVIERQKQGLPSCPPQDKNGNRLTFELSPNDLVYIPNVEERENPQLVDFENLTKEQIKRIYKMVSCTGSECHFVPNHSAKEIMKNENGTNSKSERIQNIDLDEYDEKGKNLMIKSICWKLKVNRIGKIDILTTKKIRELFKNE